MDMSKKKTVPMSWPCLSGRKDLIRIYLNYLDDPETALEIIKQFWNQQAESKELHELMTQAQDRIN